LSLRFRYFALRKLHFLLRARAMVAFPGGFGTFDELFETLTLVQTRKIEALPVVLVGEAWWRRAVDFGFLLAEGTIGRGDRRLYCFAEDAFGIWERIGRWYRNAGRSAFPKSKTS
jgi:predicted Rossmann-fold nucleotide-binding protein